MNNHEHYLWDGEAMTGPFSHRDLSGMVERGEMSSDAQVGVAGTDKWIPFSEWWAGSSQPVEAKERDDDMVNVVMTLDVPDALEGIMRDVLTEVFEEAGIETTVTVRNESDPPIPGGIRIANAAGEEIELPPGPEDDAEDYEYESDIRVFGNGMSILSENFYGTSAQSPNCRFAIGWNPDGYRMLDGNTVVARGSESGLGLGIVTDVGMAVLACSSEGFIGSIFGILPNGEIKFRVNGLTGVFGMVATSDGRTLICSAYDGNAECILFYELPSGKRNKRIRLKHDGVVGKIRYDEDSRVVEVHYERKGPIHHYSADGKFLEADTWEQDRIQYMNGYQLFYLAKEKLEKNRKSRVPDDVIDLLKAALRHPVSQLTKAKIHRSLGEALVVNEKISSAIAHLRAALKLNPKVGCAKQLKKIEENEK
ncbi:MAG: hypothetical protein K9M97_08150 [Akkermansiaceae bacterium]|nr:hypothetical protein [Akkermansiaceae bacterium]